MSESRLVELLRDRACAKGRDAADTLRDIGWLHSESKLVTESKLMRRAYVGKMRCACIGDGWVDWWMGGCNGWLGWVVEMGS